METRTFRLNKLVRDKIVESTEAQDGSVEYRILEGDELQASLLTKLEEEMEELKHGKESSLEKLADLREVIESIAVSLGHSLTELHSLQYDKRQKIGGFTAGFFIDTVTLPENNQWAEYYAGDPVRFPEVKSD